MRTTADVPAEPWTKATTDVVYLEAVEAIKVALSSRSEKSKQPRPFLSCCDVAVESKTKRYVGLQTVYAIKLLKPWAMGSNEDETEQYALRHLQKGIMMSAIGTEAIESLLTECTLLSRLEPHPHLVRLVAFQKDSPEKPILPKGIDGYFSVTENIVETLDDRLAAFRQRSRQPLSQISVDELLQVVVDSASALRQIHASSYVYFIRPEKIGFDRRGRTKLFDFGECQESGVIGHRLSRSDRIVTLAYTAPEVFLLESIGCSADVYGLAMIIWEMISLRKPCHGYSRAQHFAEVVMSEIRPSLHSI
jgi:serine/threonine protein kinase